MCCKTKVPKLTWCVYVRFGLGKVSVEHHFASVYLKITMNSVLKYFLKYLNVGVKTDR